MLNGRLFGTTRVSWYQNSQKHSPNIPPSLSSDSSQALQTFPPSIPLGSNTRVNPGDTAGRKREEPKDKNLHFLYTRLIPDLMRPWINHWSPLSHASHSHCMTTSRPSSSHTDESESKPRQKPEGIFMPDALPAATFPVSNLRYWLELAGLYIQRLGCKNDENN